MKEHVMSANIGFLPIFRPWQPEDTYQENSFNDEERQRKAIIFNI